MLTDPDLVEIITGQRGMLQGVESCVSKECLVSAIALIYSTIDALSALTRPVTQADTERSVFIDWVRCYLLPSSRVPCTPEDLYGARCGILHNYGIDSSMRRRDAAKALIYCWRNGPQPDSHHRAHIPGDALTICVEDLKEALDAAVEKFLQQIEADQALRSTVNHHLKDLLCYRPWVPVEIYLTPEPAGTRPEAV